MQNHNYTIRWTQIIPNTFMYGSRLHFNHHETIFKNRLMPSGIVIHEWKMMTNYAEEKTIPTLPILKRGATYHFSFDYDVEPSTGIYFKIIFKRRNGTIFDTRIIQQREVAMTYPNEAFSYELQMINAAATSVCFRSIKIQHQDENTDSKVLRISDIINENPSLPVLNILFAETQPLSSDAIREFENVIKVEHWQHYDIETLRDKLMHLKNKGTLHFIGYYEQSSAIAYRMATMLNGTAFVTHHLNTAGDVERDQAAPIICYTHEEHDLHAHTVIVQEMLNPSRYLNYIDLDVLNGGRQNGY